jgi:serine/threonine protein kinase
VQQLQKQCEAHVGYIPIPVVLEIGMQLCDALHHAHNLCDEENLPLGIVHRDVSPQNLIVSNVGLVKLIDFGLAKAKQSSVESHSGIIKGKLHYVAPEYLDGILDVRCDLWAVGVVLWELVTGRRLFDEGDPFKMVTLVREMPIPPASRFRAEVTSELDDILFKALLRDPSKRWQTAASLRAALATHAKEYPMLTKSQLVTWVEWVFAQKKKAREDSGVSALQEIQSGVVEVVDGPASSTSDLARLPAMEAAVLERQRESMAAMPVGEAMLARHRQGMKTWQIAVLVGLAVVGLIVGILIQRA